MRSGQWVSQLMKYLEPHNCLNDSHFGASFCIGLWLMLKAFVSGRASHRGLRLGPLLPWPRH